MQRVSSNGLSCGSDLLSFSSVSTSDAARQLLTAFGLVPVALQVEAGEWESSRSKGQKQASNGIGKAGEGMEGFDNKDNKDKELVLDVGSVTERA